MRVHLGTVFSDEHRRQIQAVSPTLELSYQPLSSYEPYVPFQGLAEVEVLCGYHVGFEMAEAPKLRWLLVVVCLPLTEETRGAIGEPELRAMTPSAYLVNVGRGNVIDDLALYRALKEGWIGGAGLDVWAQTPLPPNSPYFDLHNVIMTPHMSGISRAAFQREADLFCENLRRYLAAEELLNIVDKRIGY